ncbi:uncharacterized protein LOC125071396 isoform X1 [Vanessa atalanta]|uniref:uncharacterized protein LOC125071396 isoform X1 n=1 Tax=Vanessa atalanta TaxID=42275 RepID=UPI001FCDD314|nr:uncharacterized protein LOC125071396 isoform X1 [Vanessa atalanta]
MDSGSSGRQSRLLGRLLGKLRGEHRYSTLDKNFSFTSTGMSESIGCGSNEDTDTAQQADVSSGTIDDAQFAANIDLRYGGQYLTPEQLPEFCNQLHHLVEVIRNIQSYAKVTDEYPSELERRLECEAREVVALAREVRNARDSASRTRLQRRALRSQRAQMIAHLAKLREAGKDKVRELENSIRLSDRKLYKSWEALRDNNDSAAFEPLLEEIKNKQAALDCLIRLIENRRKSIPLARAPHPLPPPPGEDEDVVHIGGIRKRQDTRRNNKRRRKESSREPRSMPLSGEPSHHSPQQVTLYIQGPGVVSESTSRFRAGSAGAVTLGSLELPTPASVRDILFFTTD